MTTSTPHLVNRIATPLSMILSGLGITGGLTGLLGNPVTFSEMVGIPIASPDSPAAPYLSFIAARNIGSGATLLALLLTGQRRAAGTALMTGVVVAMADAWVCAKNGAKEGKAVGHAVMGTVIAGLGAALYWAN